MIILFSLEQIILSLCVMILNILQDGEYFLNITQEWENRLLSHCQNVEADIHSPHLPEDGKYCVIYCHTVRT